MGAAEQGDEADEAWLTSKLRSLSPVLGAFSGVHMANRRIWTSHMICAALGGALCVLCGCAARGPAARPAVLSESTVVQPAPPGRPLAEIEASLASADAEERARAAWELAGARSVTGTLLEHLRDLSRKDPSEQVREGAAWAYYHVEGASGVTGPTRAYDQAPTPVRTPRPSPPKDPHAQRVGGDVVVDVLVSATGEVVHAEVSQSVPGLDEAAIECAKSWFFTPALAEGKPVPCVARVSVSFRAFR